MRNNYITSALIVCGASLLFSGCSAIEFNKKIKKDSSKTIIIKREKPYKFTYTPLIGSRNDDEKVIVDMGVVLRVWINSYKTRANTLVSAHDVYIWAKKPDFIVGNPVPVKRRGLISSTNKLPFTLSNSEVDRSDLKTNKNIKNFINSVYEKSDEKNFKKQIIKADKFDTQIKEFLKNQKDNKATKGI